MKKGTVKFFDEARGFGFIKVDGTGEEVFVHKTSLVSKIKENDVVVFDIEKGKKGFQAVNVKLA